MKYTLFIYYLPVCVLFSEECTVHVEIDGPWGFGPDVLFDVNVESKDYKSFDNLKKAIVECFNKEPDKYLADFREKVGSGFWEGRFKKMNNLKEFIENKVSLEDFLKDKAIHTMELYRSIDDEIKTDPVEEFKKNPDNFPRYDLTDARICDIVFMDRVGNNLVLKDIYSIKDEYKDSVNVLIKYLEDHKLSCRTSKWLEEHNLDKYFETVYGNRMGGKDYISIIDEYKDPNKPKPADYKDMVIINGVIDKSGGSSNKKIKDSVKEGNNNEENGSNAGFCCCQ